MHLLPYIPPCRIIRHDNHPLPSRHNIRNHRQRRPKEVILLLFSRISETIRDEFTYTTSVAARRIRNLPSERWREDKHFAVLFRPFLGEGARAKGGKLETVSYDRETFWTRREYVFTSVAVFFVFEEVDCQDYYEDRGDLPGQRHGGVRGDDCWRSTFDGFIAGGGGKIRRGAGPIKSYTHLIFSPAGEPMIMSPKEIYLSSYLIQEGKVTRMSLRVNHFQFVYQAYNVHFKDVMSSISLASQ